MFYSKGPKWVVTTVPLANMNALKYIASVLTRT